jgi:type IV pilus assembly protein PilM
MALPFINGKSKKREQMLAIDLGGRTTKAVYLQRKGAGFVLSRYAVLDAPIYEKNLSADLLTEHLKAVSQAVDARGKPATLAIGVNDSVVRHADLPQIPLDDMRQILKNNTKNYLQQDLPGHIFDCSIILPRVIAKPGEKAGAAGVSPKHKVLVAGAKKQIIEDMQSAMRNAGLVADHIIPGLVGPINTFEMALPEIFAREVVALVDIGFKNTSICLLQEGELILSRVVAIGGDRVTSGLAEALGISYAEAEGIKVGMPTEVLPNLESLVMPLGRELRASIDFFEHQQDRTVSHVYLTGASARSELIVQILQGELMIECKPWNPVSFLEFALPAQQAGEIDQVAYQLGVAVGAALAAF